MNKQGHRRTEKTVGKPMGGYRIITTQQICAVWSAYRCKTLAAFLDVRVYWALHEIAERRARGVPPKGRPSIVDQGVLVREIRTLLGKGSHQRIRASLQRLQGTRVVELTDREIRFGDPRQANADQQEARAMLERIDHRTEVRERSIAIPRRTLRYLARNGRSALCATILAHLIRCLWQDGDRFCGTGSCSIAFVRKVFGVHERSVKGARAALRQMEWLQTVSAAQWHVNAHGARIAINLAWNRSETGVEFPRVECGNTKSPPLPAVCDTKSPPPNNKHNLPSGSKNHNRACGGSAGVRKRTENPGKPAWHRVAAGDLRSVARMASLFEQAVERGFVRECAGDRLRFFAAAEHALRVGTLNPCGLFITVVRYGLWKHLSQADENRALEKLRRLEVENGGNSPGHIPSVGAKCLRRADDEGSEQREFIMGLVTELAELRSFEFAATGARNASPRNDLNLAAA